MSTRAELEARMIEDPQDDALRLVYADAIGDDPRGALIVMQDQDLIEQVDDHIAAHADALLGPLAPYATLLDGSGERAFHWHLGFIHHARLGFDSNEVDDEALSLDRALAALVAHPSGMLVDTLILTINMIEDGSYFQQAIDAIAAHAMPALRTLRLGEFTCAGGPGGEGDYEYEISWSSLGDASKLWAALPRLESLVLQVGLGGTSARGDKDVIGVFDLPRLQRLEVITGGLGEGCLRSFANARLPEATYIDLWLGSSHYGAGGTVEDLAPLLAGTHVPKLAHLGLMNSEFSDAICVALAGSAILPRLEELSLAYGTMTDAGAEALAPVVEHLKRLDVSHNCLTEAGLELLRAHCDGVVEHEQKIEDRYVSLSE